MPRLKKTIEYLLYLFIFLLPWQTVYLFQERFINGVKWEYGSLGIYLTEVLLWVIIILFCLNGMVGRKSKGQKTGKHYSWMIFILSFVFMSALSIIWANDGTLAFFYFLRLAEAIIVFFFVLKSGNAGSFSWILVFSGLVQSFLAIGQFLIQGVAATNG